MPKTYYLPSDDNGKASWLNNLAAKLPTYQAALGLTPADVASVTTDAAFFDYVLKAQTQVAAYSQQWTAYKNAARSGSDPALGLAPIAPNLGVAPAEVAPGIIGRATALVARIKPAPGYTVSIGQALQIIGAEHPVDPTTLKPVLYATSDAGHVDISWLKQGMDALELWVDRGDGKGFVFLAIDSIPDYTDTAAMPPAGQSALWKYKDIYLQAAQRVGQWSDVVSIPVAG
jgi:hypothetical protein